MKNLFFPVILALISPCSASEIVTNPLSAHFTPTQNLKTYALTVCLGNGFPGNTEVKTEANAVAHFYIEKGRFSIEAYNAVADLAKDALTKTYPSENGEKLVFMKCYDFFHGKKLDALVQKYVRIDKIK